MNLVTDEQGNSTRLFSSRDSSQAGPGNSLTFTSQEVEVYDFRFNSENRAKKNLISFNVTEGRFVVGATKPVTRITGEIKGDLDSLISGGVVILTNLPVSSDNLVFSINDSSGTQTLEQGFFMVESLKLVPFYSLSNKREGQFIDWSIRCENDLNAFLSIINLKEKKDLKQVNPDAKATLVFSQKGIIDALQNPYTQLDFAISGAKIEGKKLPNPVTDLFISGNYNNGEKHSGRSASIRIYTLHARVGDSFIDGKARSEINFDVTAQKLQYGNITADSIAFSGISSGAITEIKSCNFSYGGGQLSLDGVLRTNEDQTISGNVSWTADLCFRLDTNFISVDNENLWKFNFKITGAQLTNVVPIEKALSFIRQKSKEDILISNLNFSTFYVREKLYFQDVAIKNSVSDMNIFGTYSTKDTLADLVLKLSLSDLLFKSLKKRMIETGTHSKPVQRV